MSVASVQNFLNTVSEDTTLQEELAKAMEAENDRQAVTDLANSKGYDFSSEELWAEVQKRQSEMAEKQEAGELSDEELEAVAGGEVWLALTVSVAAGTAGLTAGIASTSRW